MIIPFLDLEAQHRPIQDEINRAIGAVFARHDFVLGDDVSAFEAEFAAYCNSRYAIGLDSGLSALKLALEVCGVGPGHEVIVPANTFIATAAAVTFVGARVVLVDVEPNSYSIDPLQIERAITERTKAIIPVHLYGIPANMDAIMEIADRHGLIVIEDACQAHGAYYGTMRVGAIGHAAAFSFYPGKNLGAAGDGGMLVTNNQHIDEAVRAMRNCGQREKYHHVTTPYNHRLDTLQAAVLRIKLRYLDQWNEQRCENAALYNRYLDALPVALPFVDLHLRPVWHLYVIRSERRNALKEHLSNRGIATGMHYPMPIHLQPYYARLGYKRGDFPFTERYAEEVLSLPMFPELSEDMIQYVADAIAEFHTHEALVSATVTAGD